MKLYVTLGSHDSFPSPIIHRLRGMGTHRGYFEGTTFNQLLLDAITRGLASFLGKETSRAVNFYVDPHIALKDPRRYSESLNKMFGIGFNDLISRIIAEVCTQYSIEEKDLKSFEDCVSAAKRKFLEQRT